MNSIDAILDGSRRHFTHENAQTKARRLLIEGRVLIARADRDEVVARVRGDNAIHTVMHSAGHTRCDCDARSNRCSHALAVALVWTEGSTW